MDGDRLQRLEELALEAQEGSDDTHRELWRSTEQLFQAIALYRGVRPDDVCDLVQDALLSCFRALASFNPERGLYRSWAGRTMHNRINDYLRQRQRIAFRTDQLDTPRGERPFPEPRAPHGHADALISLGSLLRSLSEQQRLTLALVHVQGLTSREAAPRVGVSAGRVRHICREAIERVRQAAGISPAGASGEDRVHSFQRDSRRGRRA